jgi:xylan 1,4-beta-xylosidase
MLLDRFVNAVIDLRRRTFIGAILGVVAGVVGVGALSNFAGLSRTNRTSESANSSQTTESRTGLLPEAEVTLAVDSPRVVGGLDSALWANIGYDPIFSGTMGSETDSAWDLVRENRSLRYVRCHNMFSDKAPGQQENCVYGCRIYDEDGKGNSVYNWNHLDQVLDRWLSVGLRPILEVDFMPDKLAEGAIVRNYSGGAINTPRDYDKWRNLVYETVRHCKERHGAEEIRRWYWEIWNEPDLKTYFIDGLDPSVKEKFTPAKVARLNRMYDYFVDGATAADEHVRVGGPGIAGNENYLRAFLDHCVRGTNEANGKTGTRIDFISWHGYGTVSATLTKNRTMRRLIENEFPSLADRELQQNEWGQELRMGADANHSESVFREYEAAFLCRYVDAVLSDTSARVHKFLRWGQITGSSSGGFGLRTLTSRIGSETYRTAVLNAYEMLAKLGDELVELTGADSNGPVGGIAARSGPALVQALIYSFDENNRESTGASKRIEVNFRGISHSESVRIQHYRIDAYNSNPFRLWVRAGRPSQPSGKLAEEMRAHSKLQLIGGLLTSRSDHDLVVGFELPVNACSLLSLELG